MTTAVQVEVYTPAPWAGTALSPGRPGEMEEEIREEELVRTRDLAVESGLVQVGRTSDQQLARIRCARSVRFPLLTPWETQVWRAWLPTTYSTAPPAGATAWDMIRSWANYAYDQPPVSVLEVLRDVRRAGEFDTLEIWTPEVVRPDPILVGHRTFDQVAVGPFLIARWGESLVPFEEIKEQVAARANRPQQVSQQLHQLALQASQQQAQAHARALMQNLQAMPQGIGMNQANLAVQAYQGSLGSALQAFAGSGGLMGQATAGGFFDTGSGQMQ